MGQGSRHKKGMLSYGSFPQVPLGLHEVNLLCEAGKDG